jgi:hypothetical protein
MPRMKRREFLKLIGAGVVGAMLPASPHADELQCEDLKNNPIDLFDDLFPPDNPAVHFKEVYLADGFPAEHLDAASLYKWAAYCQARDLTMKGHISPYAPAPTRWDQLREAAEVGKCTSVWNAGKLEFWPSYDSPQWSSHIPELEIDTPVS